MERRDVTGDAGDTQIELHHRCHPHTTQRGRFRRATICDNEYGPTSFGTLNWIDNRPLQIEEYKDIFRKAPDTRSREPSVITWPCPPDRDQL